MKSKIILTVLSILLVSGCAGLDLGGLQNQVGVGGSGMEITSFTAEPTPVFSGGSVRVIMETENMGGIDVPINNAIVYLTGASFSEWNSAGAAAIYKSNTKILR